MKLLVDMNLSPQWVPILEKNGIHAQHWSSIGASNASDQTIMEWARSNQYIVFTNDLDFGALLVVTQAIGPSVIQVRAQDVTPQHLEQVVVSILREHATLIAEGALIIIDEGQSRIRILPLTR